jgi:hypothetical protein
VIAGRCRFRISVSILSGLLLIGGCAAPNVEPAHTLTGLSKPEVEDVWGTPYFSFHDQDDRELIVYRFSENYLHTTAIFILPIQEKTRVFCYLLEVDKKGIVTSYETPSLLSPVSLRGNCLASLFSDDWSIALHLARKYDRFDALTARAREGDAAAAILLAHEFGRTYQLEKLASEGNPDAAFAMQSIKGESSSAVLTPLLRTLCDAARRDDGHAQLYVGELLTEAHWEHSTEARRAKLRRGGFFPANSIAYFWYRQAARNDVAGAHGRLAELATAMSEDDIAMANRWNFDPLTIWDLSPAPGATGCPMPSMDARQRARVLDAKFAALTRLGDAMAAQRLGDTETLARLAAGGDIDAAIILAADYTEPRYALALANSGDEEVGLRVYRRMPKDERATPLGWGWLCHAANAGAAEARRKVGYWHRSDRQDRARREIQAALERMGIARDDSLAYMWYVLADAAAGHADETGIPERLRRNASPADTARARRMADDWRPGDCPSATQRFAPPGGT